MPQDKQDIVDHFKNILYICALLLCVGLFFWIGTSHYGRGFHEVFLELIYHFIPDALVALVAGLVIYHLFTKKGLAEEQFLADEVASRVADRMANLSLSQGSHHAPIQDVVAFYPNYRDINWSALLASANSVDIAVSYYDSWVKQNHEHVVELFKRGGSIRLVVSSPNNDEVMKLTAARFPEYDVNTIRLKVRNTGKHFQDALVESHSHSGRLEVYYFPNILNYCAIRINNQTLLLSVYEHFRRQRIDSSGMLLNLTTSPHLREYWDKEFGGLLNPAYKVPVSELTHSGQH